jgi:hypothetical protein
MPASQQVPVYLFKLLTDALHFVPHLQLFRSFWLYAALHDLASPEAPADWRDAAGRIAGATPVMLAGLEAGSDMDGLERLKVRVLVDGLMSG